MNQLEKINKEIEQINLELPLQRIFVINNEETFESKLFLRTNGLSLEWINNFCLNYGLSYDLNNQQILLLYTHIKTARLSE